MVYSTLLFSKLKFVIGYFTNTLQSCIGTSFKNYIICGSVSSDVDLVKC